MEGVSVVDERLRRQRRHHSTGRGLRPCRCRAIVRSSPEHGVPCHHGEGVKQWASSKSATGAAFRGQASLERQRPFPERQQPARPGIRFDVVGSVTIEANVFDHNRHDIASDGSPGAHYTATYNLVLDGAVEQSFDVHGGKDRQGLHKHRGHRRSSSITTRSCSRISRPCACAASR